MKFPSDKSIQPAPVWSGKPLGVADLVDGAFRAYNGARLREACRVYSERMLRDDVTIGMSLTGALTPAGLGMSCIIPMMRLGMVDWIVSTGANLYHDAHFAIGHRLYQASPFLDDVELRRKGIIRIYDVVFDYQVLLDTDAFFREVMRAPEFQAEMGTAEFHWRLGRWVAERERTLTGRAGVKSVLAAAWQHAVPVYTSSPGDSSIGMNVAALELFGSRLRLNPSRDVNETAAIVLEAKRGGGRSGVLIWGGGSPKNFVLQTEPQIQEVLGIEEKGHDFFLQFTDARPDTGGLSGATPSEAVSWGKVDPDRLPDTVVCYTDSTIAMPIVVAYACERHGARIRRSGFIRKPRRLYDRLPELLERLRAAAVRAERRDARKAARKKGAKAPRR
jgi:deoxyhypusine synthase